jgi:hypothetical protein
MGSRSNSRSTTTTNSGSAGGNMDSAMSKLPPATAEGANKMYQTMLGGQLGVLGDTLGGLVESGNKFMESNPAAANFIRAVGGQPMQFETPDFLKGMADKYNPPKPEPTPTAEPQQAVPAWMQHASPDGRAAYEQWMNANGGKNFNVNDYMRNQNLGRF